MHRGFLLELYYNYYNYFDTNVIKVDIFAIDIYNISFGKEIKNKNSSKFFKEKEMFFYAEYLRAFAIIKISENYISTLDRIENLRSTQLKFSESPDPMEIFFTRISI